MATTAPATIESLISRYAADIAFVAEEPAATTVSDFTDQLRTATNRFDMAGINGSDELEDAATYLNDADGSTDDTERNVLLKLAAKNLRGATEMVDEYRDMV
ncbi:hypothetical protein [Streptomyces sp. NPDC005969]|uniref:hypothetical protein n=1 Tax=Streptomyces sp. NPDC005969 TaxID=3156722 RepID=UPI0033C797C4